MAIPVVAHCTALSCLGKYAKTTELFFFFRLYLSLTVPLSGDECGII
jgi:hypothetical protein